MLIGLTGYAQHGKDSAAKFLAEEILKAGGSPVQIAFADGLRSLAEYLNPIVRPDLGWGSQRYTEVMRDVGYEDAKKSAEFRRVLQQLGTGAREIIGEDVWVQALDTVYRKLPPLSSVIVTDVRFHNEERWIHENGGVLLAVSRVTEDGRPYDNGIGTDHPSEAFIHELLIDYQVIASNLEELEEEIKVFFDARVNEYA